MKDIGKMERRLNNVEYYTALSLLEKDAEALVIKDAAGLERFKNGILVDNIDNQLASLYLDMEFLNFA